MPEPSEKQIAHFKKVISAGKHPLRTCQSLHSCFGCGGDIKLGESYRDGGYASRIHEECYEIIRTSHGLQLAELLLETRTRCPQCGIPKERGPCPNCEIDARLNA